MSAIEHGGGESHRCDASSSTLSQVGIIAINRPQREKKRIKNKSKMKSQFQVFWNIPKEKAIVEARRRRTSLKGIYI